MSAAAAQLAEKLAAVKVSSLPTSTGGVVVIDSTESFEQAFNRLVSRNVLSAPVRDVDTNKYVGFLDMRDLVSLVVSVYDECAVDGSDKKQPDSLDQLLKQVAEIHAYNSAPPSVTYMARRNPFVAVPQEASLLDVMRAFATPRLQRVHRIAVLDHTGVCTAIVSQSTAVKYISAHKDDLLDAAVRSASVGDLGLGTYPALTVSDTTSALDTFKLMDSKQRSGFGIVNAHGLLIGNVSGRDLKQFITVGRIDKLAMNVHEFLGVIHQTQVDIRTPAIGVTKDKSFAHVIDKLAATRVHRMFVVKSDTDFKCVGVISLSDVVRAIMKDDEVVKKAAAPANVVAGTGAGAAAGAAAAAASK